MYLHCTYLWVNKSYLLDFKEENGVSCEKLIFLCLNRNDGVIKTLLNHCRGKQQQSRKPSFRLKRNYTVAKIFVIYILTINDLVVKLSHIYGLMRWIFIYPL